MSSAVVSTPAALGRPFVFDDDDQAEGGSLASASRAALDRTAEGGCPHINLPESPLARLQSAISNQKSKISPARVTPASQLDIRPAPEMVSSGAPAIDALTGGLPRGCLTEICGPSSSGRTTLLLAALAAATRRGEFCAVVDASDALDPHSVAAAGVELERLLWVRCGEDAPRKNSSPQSHRDTEKNGNQKTGCSISRAPSAREACPELVERVGTWEVRKDSQSAFNFDRTGSMENGSKENVSRQSDHRLEQVLRATDLLLESGGFGLIVLDLGDLPPQSARRIPLTTWFRFRRAVENKPTILLAIEQKPIAGSCSSLLLKLGAGDPMLSADKPAAKRCEITAHSLPRAGRGGASRGFVGEDQQTPEGRKKITAPEYPAHAHLLTGLDVTAELIRSRLDRKPPRPVAFATKTAWAG
jgi:recombination protein RecA